MNLLSLKTCCESKCSGYLNFLWIYSQDTSRQIDVVMYSRTVYRRILKFFSNKQVSVVIFQWFCLWVSQSFMPLKMRHRNYVIYGYFFWVFWSEILCAHLYTAVSRVRVCSIRVHEPWCRVLKKCLKLCSMKFSTYLGSILQQKQNCIQGSDTNLEFNTLCAHNTQSRFWFTIISHHSFSPFSICTADCKL